MLDMQEAFEVELFGTFSDPISARYFNKRVGDKIYLYRMRTTLSYEGLISKLFVSGNDGNYLEACVGKGNVQVKITKDVFPAVRARVGICTEKRIFKRRDYMRQAGSYKGIYKTTNLLSREEIERLVNHPYKFVSVQNFGIVDTHNVQKFLRLMDEAEKRLKEKMEESYVHA